MENYLVEIMFATSSNQVNHGDDGNITVTSSLFVSAKLSERYPNRLDVSTFYIYVFNVVVYNKYLHLCV